MQVTFYVFKEKISFNYLEHKTNFLTFAPRFKGSHYMVAVVQLVRASDCGSECRGFESHLPPTAKNQLISYLEPYFFKDLRLLFCQFGYRLGPRDNKVTIR